MFTQQKPLLGGAECWKIPAESAIVLHRSVLLIRPIFWLAVWNLSQKHPKFGQCPNWIHLQHKEPFNLWLL